MIAWVFPGQGSQFVGMAGGLDAQPTRAAWDVASAVLDWDIRSVCLRGPEELLRSTEVAQLAILTASVAAANALEATGVLPDLVAGHSVGEFAALVVARALSLEDAVRVVAARADAMARAGTERDGCMAAVIGLAPERVEEICSRAPGTVVVANVNTADQVVVSGERVAIVAIGDALRAAGARRVIPLAVSVAAHSPLMQSAAHDLERALASGTLQPPAIPFASSVTGTLIDDPAKIASVLVSAVTGRVDWPACVGALRAAGADRFVEVGPGTVLSGLVRRILPDVRVTSVSDERSALALAHDLSAEVIG